MIVEIAYSRANEPVLIACKMHEEATVEEAIAASGILSYYPEIDKTAISVGIFSRKVSLESRLQDGDRIEIYRPLLIDPMAARRLRALRKAGR